MADAIHDLVAANAEEGSREPAVMGVRGAAVWAMAGQYIGFALQFVTSVVISRFFLSPAEVGLFSIALAAAMLVATLQDFGLSRYIAALPYIDADTRARCSTVALMFSCVVAGTICAGAWPVAWLYHQPQLVPLLLIIGASYLFLPLSVVPTALLARTMAFHGHFVINVGAGLAQCVVALTLAAMGYSALSLAWAVLAANVARGVIAQALRPAPPWPLRFDGLRPILGTGSRLTTLYVSGSLGTRTPDMIIGKMLTLIAVGLYSRGVSLAGQLVNLIAGAIGGVFFPAFARIRDRGEPLGPAYLRVVAGYTAVIWPGMVGLAMAAEPVVRLLYGPRWLGVAPLLTLISLAEVLFVALPLHMDLPILLGRLNRLLAFNVVDTVLSVTLLAAGCLWGVEGAMASRVVYGVGWLMLYARFMHSLVRFDVAELLRIYLKSGGAAVGALAPLAFTYLFWVGPARITLPLLLGCVMLGGIFWLVLLWALRHPAFADLAGLAGHLVAPLRRLRLAGQP